MGDYEGDAYSIPLASLYLTHRRARKLKFPVVAYDEPGWDMMTALIRTMTMLVSQGIPVRLIARRMSV